MSAHYDVIVIGAGVTGLSSAWWLARDGLRVLVLDKGVVGAEASSRNGGGPHEWIDTRPEGVCALPTTPPTTLMSRGLARRVAELFPKAAHLHVIRSWAGIVENTPDGRPVIDRIDNLTIATMSGIGFGLSPATGHAVRDLVVDGQCSFTDIAKLSLARFAGLAPDWREACGRLPLGTA